jgi:hypothetical protein
MSNALAIAAVTATLQRLLTSRVPADLPADLPTALSIADLTVTTQPPDKARGTSTNNQLNLFLYQTVISAGLRNMDMPRSAPPGEIANPPLPLELYYLVTAYGRDNDDVVGHILLGQAMRVLHDHALLSADELRLGLPGSDVHLQVERVRIRPQPILVDEMSKLWTTFQTQYRISTVYQIGLVLIESLRSRQAALPVLRQGEDDRGPSSQPDLTPPLPTIREITLPARQLAVRPGESFTIRGVHLNGDAVRLIGQHPRLLSPRELPLGPVATSSEILAPLPADTDWPAGVYSLAARIERAGDQPRTTNSAPLAVAPRITIAPLNAAPGDLTLTATCQPQVLPEQQASLLFGAREIRAEPLAAPATTLTFMIPDVSAGEYVVRLRVDGVDSIPYEIAGTPPRLQFAANQTVTVA